MTVVDLLFPHLLVMLSGMQDEGPLHVLAQAPDLRRLAQFAVNGTVVGSILALAAVGLTMVYGILRIANFAHGDLLTLGTYVALYLFALIALPATLRWGLAVAGLLVVLVVADRWVRPWLGRTALGRHLPRRRALSDGEALAVGYAALLLVVLVIGIAVPSGLSAGTSSLLVAAVAALPVAYRAGAAEPTPLMTWRGPALLVAALAVIVLAHVVIPLQLGPGGFSLAGEAALALGVLGAGALALVPSPGRDRLVLAGLAVAGLLALYLFAAPILLAVALALGAVAALSILLERFVWRRARAQGSGLLTLIIISIGLMLALRNTIVIIWDTRQRAFPDTVRRGESILGTDVLITPHQALAVGVALLVILVLHLFLRHAKVGKAMRALGDDMELARISGVDVDRVVMYVWIISGSLAALAGILYGMVRPFDPNQGWYQLLPIFAAVILGGIGSPYGALLGGFAIGLAMETSPFFGVPTDYKLAVAFGILILIMIFRPRGILGVQTAR